MRRPWLYFVKYLTFPNKILSIIWYRNFKQQKALMIVIIIA